MKVFRSGCSGGKVEPGESPAQAAARECLEETGLEVRVEHEIRPPEPPGHGANVVYLACTFMGAEDFSYVLQRVPGALAFLGACPPRVDRKSAPPNHSNRFVFDESAMVTGAAMYAALALDALRR